MVRVPYLLGTHLAMLTSSWTGSWRCSGYWPQHEPNRASQSTCPGRVLGVLSRHVTGGQLCFVSHEVSGVLRGILVWKKPNTALKFQHVSHKSAGSAQACPLAAEPGGTVSSGMWMSVVARAVSDQMPGRSYRRSAFLVKQSVAGFLRLTGVFFI